MADSGYYVGDEATGITLEEDYSNKTGGSGGGTSQGTFNGVVQGEELIINHGDDATGARLVQVYELNTISGFYKLAKGPTEYTIEIWDINRTKITKDTAGPHDLKINVMT